MNIEKLFEAAFLTDLNARILEIALSLMDDPNYSKEEATRKLVELAKMIDENNSLRVV